MFMHFPLLTPIDNHIIVHMVTAMEVRFSPTYKQLGVRIIPRASNTSASAAPIGSRRERCLSGSKHAQRGMLGGYAVRIRDMRLAIDLAGRPAVERELER